LELEVLRFSSEADSTSGLLFELTPLGRRFLCYTLEDERRVLKVRGETRVPAGTYCIELRKEGGFHERYSEYILIHTGNTDEHTAGCLIVGDAQENNQILPDGFVGKSVNAYKRIYPSIAKAIANGEEVTIKYTDYD